MVNRTPLTAEHEKRGARMVDFAGWWMPVSYRGLRDEHVCVRTKVGLFDVSHMGEIWVEGPKSLETLQWLTTNDVAKLISGKAQYSLLPNSQGGLVDDIIVYCIEPHNSYLVCVNASNVAKDFEWMTNHNRGAVIRDESAQWAQIAVQGPKAMDLCARILGKAVNELASFQFGELQHHGHRLLAARTGYTGEDGMEIFLPNAGAVPFWQELFDKGEELGVEPIGLGARDTLRTEMKYSLYGHEIDETTNPYAAGLGWVVKAKQKDFIGRDAMIRQLDEGLSHKLVGFRMIDKGIPRSGYALLDSSGAIIGRVTSGTHSPTLDEPIGIGYVSVAHASEGSEIWVNIRERRVRARVVPTPFVKRVGS